MITGTDLSAEEKAKLRSKFLSELPILPPREKAKKAKQNSIKKKKADILENVTLPPRNPTKKHRNEKRKRRPSISSIMKPSKRSRIQKALPNDTRNPLDFLAGHEKVIVLGEEDFSLSYEIAMQNFSVVGAAYKPNEYETSYQEKLKQCGCEARLKCDARKASTFEGGPFDAVVFTFPRLFESLGKEDIGTNYFPMNRQFFTDWLSMAMDKMVWDGRIYIVLIPKQWEDWKLDEICHKLDLNWRNIGEFQWRECEYYIPKNEKGEVWEPRGPTVFAIYRPEAVPETTPEYLPPVDYPPSAYHRSPQYRSRHLDHRSPSISLYTPDIHRAPLSYNPNIRRPPPIRAYTLDDPLYNPDIHRPPPMRSYSIDSRRPRGSRLQYHPPPREYPRRVPYNSYPYSDYRSAEYPFT